jgi:DNA modification methylase
MKTFLILDNRKRRAIPPEFMADDNRNPDSLVEYFLNQYTKEGDKVFDPFAGLGTTLIVSEKLGRIPFGIEFDDKRAEYIKSQIANGDNLINGNSLKLRSYELPHFDFSFASPPYMAKNDKENPFTAYAAEGKGYGRYIRDMRKIYSQVKLFMKPNTYIVIEVSNIKSDEVTPLAWDIAKEVSRVFRFEGEVVIGWKGKDDCGVGGSYGYGYDHSYCLVFKNAG